MIETIEGNHSYNLDELLNYLLREKESRLELSVANTRSNPAQSNRELAMADHYRRFYDAARHYRTNTTANAQEALRCAIKSLIDENIEDALQILGGAHISLAIGLVMSRGKPGDENKTINIFDNSTGREITIHAVKDSKTQSTAQTSLQ